MLIVLWFLIGYASSFGLIYVANKYANTAWTIGDLAYALLTGLFGPLVVVAIVISSLLFTAGNVNWKEFFDTPLFIKGIKEDKTLTIKLPYSHYANLVFKSKIKRNRTVWYCELEDESIKDLEKLIK